MRNWPASEPWCLSAMLFLLTTPLLTMGCQADPEITGIATQSHEQAGALDADAVPDAALLVAEFETEGQIVAPPPIVEPTVARQATPLYGPFTDDDDEDGVLPAAELNARRAVWLGRWADTCSTHDVTGVFEVVGLRWSRLPPQYPGDPSRVAVHHATLSAIRVVRNARGWDPETEIAYFPSAHGLALEVGERYLLSLSPSQRPGFFTGTQTRERAGVLKAARLPTEDVLAHLGATCEGGAQ